MSSRRPDQPGWHLFSRQAAALEFADSLSSDRRAQVWSVEQEEDGGKRSYIVASQEEFWRRYRRMLPHHRHHYEIIRESTPCHLYFDLEFCLVANPHIHGDSMVRTLCEEVRMALGDRYFDDGRCPPCHIVDLDSTTKSKFSRHLIVRISGAAFTDNSHVGSFVGDLLASLAKRRADEPSIAALFVAPKANELPRKPSAAAQVSFVDTSVYTRNRCFRLCTRAGPRTLLEPCPCVL